ncbi:hypothetical protein QEH52_14180 [Coraliomargarita sp. SDUM461003]|uniref:NdvB protein n=1 Tax=Thalassobacterium maritimum TaxID=3041265 RepID=A0ABU1AZW1_9BACT|nr:glycosyl hydrolase family 65 protein [Coraliomargarita sp. SDUM461003]MDQ8208670.1 hypothetical protein [Coraliomargarita sp. SDUM461003]
MEPKTATQQPALASLLSHQPGLFELQPNEGELHIHSINPPAAWKNYLFNQDYYIELDQCAQGRTRVLQAPARELPASYRYFYLKDEVSEDTWNLTQQPLNKQMDHFEAIQTPSHCRYEGDRAEIASMVRGFVPVSGSRELWTVQLTNRSAHTRKLSLFTVFPFEDGGVMRSKAWYSSEHSTCYSQFFPHHLHYKDYARLQNQHTLRFMFSTEPATSGESNERIFYGGPRFDLIPAAVAKGQCSGKPCLSEFPVGALHHSIELAPGASKEIGFFIGVERNEADVAALRTEYSELARFDEALEAVRAEQERYRDNLCIETPDATLNTFFNYWLQKQVVFQSRLNRLAGGFPIRNQLQDCMGFALLDPSAALDYLRTRIPLQNTDGYLRQWWTAGDGDQSEVCALDYQDGGIWLVICTLIIANQNDCLDFLNERFGFHDSEEEASVLEHLIRAVDRLAKNRGAHGLCLFGDGDWTDPINGPGRRGKGESTWTTCALGVAAQMLHKVLLRLEQPMHCEALHALDQELSRAVHTHCWNGSWLITGFDDEGVALGTPKDREGKIFLNSQTWAIMAGYVSEDRLPAVKDAIQSMETDAGALLLAPAFSQWNERWGRISIKQPGTTENGSIYCHAGMFKSYADCSLSNGSAALKELMLNLPLNAKNPPSKNSQAPIFVPNCYFGLKDSCEFGVSSRNISTGTAPWMLWIMVESILGIRATADGLVVDPCMPDEWNEAKIRRRFRGSTYDIQLRRSPQTGPLEICINGTSSQEARLPYGEPHYDVSIQF